MVDAGTGAVLDGADVRTPRPPASLSKVMTALTAVRELAENATVPVSNRAANIPATSVGMKAGQAWPVRDVLSALLLSSANDAATALAEAAAGDVDAFAQAQGDTALRLGLRDRPVLRDPAGLDGPSGVAGGNLMSAADLAIATRAMLRQPRLAGLVALREDRFIAPDGSPRRLVNHNKLLWSYPGSIGVKTGYTRRAGRCLIAAASRGGRTLIVVLLDAADTHGQAASLLDRWFAAPPAAGVDHLPPVRPLPPLPRRARPDEEAAPVKPRAVTALPPAALIPAVTATVALMAVAGWALVLARRSRAERAPS